MKIIFRQDSRDFHVLDHFEGVSVIPDNQEFDVGLTNPIEPPGAEYCTAISSTDVGTDQTKIVYDIQAQWNNTPHGDDGADPRDSMSAMITKGLKPLDGSPQDTRWKSYMRAEGNSGDYFLTSQNSMESLQSSMQVNINWYAEWNVIGQDGVLPEGKTWVSGHSMKVSGWRLTVTGIQFHVKHWFGYKVWMPKEIYNEELDKYGTISLIPTTKADLAAGERTLLQWLHDLVVNLGLAFQQSVMQQLTSSGFPPILYTVAKNSLGTHQTLNDTVPPDVGCAECVSSILKTAGISVPIEGIAGTSALYTWLQNNPRFTQVASPQAGDIIISPTTSLGKISHGHVGIMAMYGVQYVDDWGIISNDSDTGLVREKWCLKDWINYYQVYGGLDVCYFRLQ